MAEIDAVNYLEAGADLMSAFENVMNVIEKRGLDRSLYHLVLLRASQLNRCGFCVKMHTREARADGENDDRLDHLPIWQHSAVFSDAEKAAFAWTEALTINNKHTNFANFRITLRRHFNEEEIATLTALIAMINVWNRLHISNH